MTRQTKRMTHKQLEVRSLGPLRRLAAGGWRVVANGLDDPIIRLNRKRGYVYEIDAWRVGVWLQGRSSAWIDKFRRQFSSCREEQRGEAETVFAWPILDSQTPELLAFIGAQRRRQRSATELARLIEAGRATRFGAREPTT